MKGILQYLREIGMEFIIYAINDKEAIIDVIKWGRFKFSKRILYRIFISDRFAGFGIDDIRVKFAKEYPITESNTLELL